MTVRITPIPCLRDNYAYLVEDAGDAWVVDPAEADPVLSVLSRRTDLTLRGVLATHHHMDHVGGIEALVAACGGAGAIWVAGHARDAGRIPAQSRFVDAPAGRFAESGVAVGGRPLLAMWIPGHTVGAIAWFIPGSGVEAGDVFTGDTLFAAGCGRLFEGTPEQMHASLQALTALPAATRLWFGHEYTAGNLRFAATVEPENPAVRERAASLPAMTTPTTVGEERATNPFVRAATAGVLAERRAAKDVFRG